MKGYWKDGNKFIEDSLHWYIKNSKLERSLNKVCTESSSTFVGDFYNVVPVKKRFVEKPIYLVTVYAEENGKEEIHKVLAYKNGESESMLYHFDFITWHEWSRNWWPETYHINGDNDKYGDYYNKKRNKKFWANEWWDEGYNLSLYFGVEFHDAYVLSAVPYEPNWHPEYTSYEENTYLNTRTDTDMLHTRYFIKVSENIFSDKGRKHQKMVQVPENTVWRHQWKNQPKIDLDLYDIKQWTHKRKTSQDIYSDEELKYFKNKSIYDKAI